MMTGSTTGNTWNLEKLFYSLFPPLLSKPSTIFCKFLLHRPDNLLHPTYLSSSHSLSRILQKSSDLHCPQLVVAWYKCRLPRLEEIARVVFYGGSDAFPPLQLRSGRARGLGSEDRVAFFFPFVFAVAIVTHGEECILFLRLYYFDGEWNLYFLSLIC